jgi:hypothetical protein
MKITEQELRELVREALRSNPKVKKHLKESSDYMAGRQVIISAQQASLDFEQEIIKTLGLVNPDDLHPSVRQKFNDIVETMKDDIVRAVKGAVDGLSPFPRVDDLNKQKSGGSGQGSIGGGGPL